MADEKDESTGAIKKGKTATLTTLHFKDALTTKHLEKKKEDKSDKSKAPEKSRK